MRERGPRAAPPSREVDYPAREAEDRRRRLELAAEIVKELASFYLEKKPMDDDRRRHLIGEWAEKSNIYVGQRFPIDGGRLHLPSGSVLDYGSLHERHPDLYDLLGRFTGRLRNFSNKDFDDSALIPEEYFKQMNQMYLGLADKVARQASSLKKGEVEEAFNQSIQQEIDVALLAFHAIADSYPVAEELLVGRHVDIFSHVLRDFLVALEPGWSEKGACTHSRKFLAALFQEEYQGILRQTLDAQKTRLSPEEIGRIAEVYTGPCSEYREKRYG